MRTLKYRAYIKPLKRYAEKYETILCLHQCNMEPSWTVNISPEEYYGDEDLVIEQFTGLLDRNGKEIYMGDIVRYAIRPSRTTVVEWWSGEEEYYPCCTTSGFSLPYSEDGYEVIGNVHENPELLEINDVDWN